MKGKSNLEIERELFQKYDRDIPNDLRRLQEELLILHESLPNYLANKFRYIRGGCHDTMDDIRQCARMGIMEAAIHYDPYNEKKASFFSYCTYWCNKYVYDFIDDDKTVRLPKHVIRELTKIGKKDEMTTAEAANVVGKEMGVDNIPISAYGISTTGGIDDEGVSNGLDLDRELWEISALVERDYVERSASESEILGKFFKDKKNLRNLMIFEDSIGETAMSTRQLSDKYGIHHTQIANILNGKKVNGRTVIEPFVDKFRRYIIKALEKEGIAFSEYSYEAFVKQFLIIKEDTLGSWEEKELQRLREEEAEKDRLREEEEKNYLPPSPEAMAIERLKNKGQNNES